MRGITPFQEPIFGMAEAALQFYRETIVPLPPNTLLRALTLRVDYSQDFSKEVPLGEYPCANSTEREHEWRRKEAFRRRLEPLAKEYNFKVSVTLVRMPRDEKEQAFCTLLFVNQRPSL